MRHGRNSAWHWPRRQSNSIAAFHRHRAEPQAGAVARVTKVVRMMEQHPDSTHSLAALAREARLSRYHFLRVFEALTGVTPHQYVLRGRLRRAALRLTAEPTRILDIALDCGFGDISNFNRTFRAEFGVPPRTYRASGTI